MYELIKSIDDRSADRIEQLLERLLTEFSNTSDVIVVIEQIYNSHVSYYNTLPALGDMVEYIYEHNSEIISDIASIYADEYCNRCKTNRENIGKDCRSCYPDLHSDIYYDLEEDACIDVGGMIMKTLSVSKSSLIATPDCLFEHDYLIDIGSNEIFTMLDINYRDYTSVTRHEGKCLDVVVFNSSQQLLIPSLVIDNITKCGRKSLSYYSDVNTKKSPKALGDKNGG